MKKHLAAGATADRNHRSGSSGTLSAAGVRAMCVAFAGLSLVAADPQLDAWLTQYSGQYARIYSTDAARLSGTATTTWGNGSTDQLVPAYVGIQELYSSDTWVYIRSTGLGIHTMGPWYLNAAHTQAFPGLPTNQKAFYRLPRTTSVSATKTLTGLGAIGYFVDGVAMFDTQDGQKWTGSSESPNGTGYWNRDAYVNEGATFDPANAHQPGSGEHHYHANPAALRYLLGDHVDFDPATRTYHESTGPVTRHSPILGWVRDGFPIYGPYGYASATNPASGWRRMLSGYQLRNGERGADNLTSKGRTTLPAWATRLYNVSAAQSGPAAGAAYPLGRYMEDKAFLGDLVNPVNGQAFVAGTDFDLDEFNGRFCVTPEFPGGTYAYFVSIAADGTPVFPYNIGRAFQGAPTGGAVTSLTETVRTNFLGGPNLKGQLQPPAVRGGSVTLVWSGVEGGTYRVESSTNLGAWTTLGITDALGQSIGKFTNSAANPHDNFRVVRTALASFDPVTGGSGGNTGGEGLQLVSVAPVTGSRGTTLTLTLNLPNSAPPAMAPILSVTLGNLTGTGNVHVSQTQVRSTFGVPKDAATGPQTVTVIFPGPPGMPGNTQSYQLVNGFTIN